MKQTPIKLMLTIGQFLFTAILPLALLFFEYTAWGEAATAFRVSFTGIILALAVLSVFKKTVLKRRIENLEARLNHQTAQFCSETDSVKLERLRSQIRGGRALSTVLAWIVPLFGFVALMLVVGALEKELIRLSGVLFWIGASLLLGFICALGESQCVKSKYEADSNEN